MHSFRKKEILTHPLVMGTVILTLTGFLSRFIGFFYRIFLSRVFGAEGMGIYQLIAVHNTYSSLTRQLCSALRVR